MPPALRSSRWGALDGRAAHVHRGAYRPRWTACTRTPGAKSALSEHLALSCALVLQMRLAHTCVLGDRVGVNLAAQGAGRVRAGLLRRRRGDCVSVRVYSCESFSSNTR